MRRAALALVASGLFAPLAAAATSAEAPECTGHEVIALTHEHFGEVEAEVASVECQKGPVRIAPAPDPDVQADELFEPEALERLEYRGLDEGDDTSRLEPAPPTP